MDAYKERNKKSVYVWEGVKNHRRIRTEAVDVFSHDCDYKLTYAVNVVAAIIRGLLRCGYTTPLATTSGFLLRMASVYYKGLASNWGMC